jgi:Right handed beta helix region
MQRISSGFLLCVSVIFLSACGRTQIDTSSQIDGSDDFIESLALPTVPTTAKYYVSLSGSDNQSCAGGNQTKPFASIQKAVDCVQPGDTVFLRGGRYYMPTTPNNAAYVYLERSGTKDAPITFMSHPGEWAILDFSRLKGGDDQERVYFAGADWLVFRNLEIYKSPAQGIYLEQDANDNFFINLAIKESWGTGFQIYKGSRNLVMCSDAIDNGKNNIIDPGNSDGFSSGGQGGPSLYNRFYYNLSGRNADDGYDSWVSQRSVFVGNISSNNGYNGGNGIGFKLGPGPAPNNIFGIITGWTTDPPRKDWFQANGIIRRNISYGNSAGFESNSGAGNVLDNNTAWKNEENFVMYENNFNPNNTINTLRNNLSYQGGLQYLTATSEVTNSWNFAITNPRFSSLTPSSPNFLSLLPTSPVIDKGTQLPWLKTYAGAAPDLGALELGKQVTSLRASCPKRP